MKNTMKALVAGAALVVALVGCGGRAADSNSTAPEEDAPIVVTGDDTIDSALTPDFAVIEEDYVIPEEIPNNLTEEEAKIFEEVTWELVGVGYKPAAVIATQLVSGTNRAYLCQGTVVTPEGGTTWYIITVYTNLEGKSKILNIKELDISMPAVIEDEAASSDVVGGWTIVKPEGNALTGDAADAFAAATEKLLGKSYTPIALLGSTTETGPFYLVLAYGEAVTPNPQGGLYLMQVMAKGSDMGIDINSSKIAQFDLLAYV